MLHHHQLAFLLLSSIGIFNVICIFSEDGRFPCNGMITSATSKTSVPDVITHDLQSLNLHGGGDDSRSFLVLDQDEKLCVESVAAWCSKLGCDTSATCKVVSIFGNTGEGKSHTLNHTFFAGSPVFSTSNQQEAGGGGRRRWHFLCKPKAVCKQLSTPT